MQSAHYIVCKCSVKIATVKWYIYDNFYTVYTLLYLQKLSIVVAVSKMIMTFT